MASTTYTWNGFETTLATTLGVGGQTAQLTTTTGLQAPCYLLLDADVPASREWVRVNSINGTTIENVVRNQAGSVGDIEHTAGAKVRCVFSHQQLAAIFGDITTIEGNISSVSGALTAHTSGTDQHPEYLKSASHTKALHDALNINAGTLDGIDSTGFSLSNHSHSIYATTSHLHTGVYSPNSHLHTGVYAPNSHVGSGGSAHAAASTSVAGFMSASDKTILNNLNSGGGYQTITAGTGLTGGGSGSTVTIGHELPSPTSISNLSGAAVVNTIAVNTRGHVTSLGQRNLTAANIGAAATSHTHTNYVDRAAGSLSGSILYLASGGATGGAATLSNNVGVSRFMHNGTVIAEGNGTNYLEMFGIPYSAGNFELRCVEDGAGRTVSYFAIASSRRFKENIEATSGDHSWRWLLDLQQTDFTYISDPGDEPHRFFIAEELFDVAQAAGVDPEVYVTRDSDGEIVNIDEKAVLSDVVVAIRDLDARIAALESV